MIAVEKERELASPLSCKEQGFIGNPTSPYAIILAQWAIGLVMAVDDYFDNAMAVFFSSYIAGGLSVAIDELVCASSAYALGAVVGILSQHLWIERVGYRNYIALCAFGFAVGGIAASLCNSSVEFAWARGMQGLFVGPMLSACRILIRRMLPLSFEANSRASSSATSSLAARTRRLPERCW
jgi:MFS family permease